MEDQVVENPVELRFNTLTDEVIAGNLRILANRQIIGFMKTRPVILGRTFQIFKLLSLEYWMYLCIMML